jgi:hypothetical protein
VEGKLTAPDIVNLPAPNITTPPAGCAFAQEESALLIVDALPEYAEMVLQIGQLASGTPLGIPACDQFIPRLASITPVQSCVWATAGVIKIILSKNKRYNLSIMFTKLHKVFLYSARRIVQLRC